MMPWFLSNPQRLSAERSGIDELAKLAIWLVGTDWLFDGGLCLDFVVRAHGVDYEFRLSFPTYFPEAPIVVKPLNQQNRLSSHQYGGADGPLCLEWGPDNWYPHVTASQMIESTYRLLEIENPRGTESVGPHITAPSRHSLTLGQELRSEWARWYLAQDLKQYLLSFPAFASGGFKFSFGKHGEVWTSFVLEADTSDTAKAFRPTLPHEALGGIYTGVWFITQFTAAELKAAADWNSLKALLQPYDIEALFAADDSDLITGFDRQFFGLLIVDANGGIHFVIVHSQESVCRFTAVESEQDTQNLRSPDQALLHGKKIGIVGLGSAGSKIAFTLTRMGASSFYLSDPDVFLPENIRRHSLDWTAVAQHKVDALAISLKLVSPDADIHTSRIHLTGQESNASVNGVLQKLSDCDVIIDATANSRVFNLLSAISTAHDRPLIWLEIFGGGIGGMIARSRPNHDPAPQSMRNAYLQYCTENPAPESLRSVADYAENSGDKVLEASDADVAIIAHHAARLVIDSLRDSSSASFPYSMYLIGLRAGWVFHAPFATIPISMEAIPVSGSVQNSANDQNSVFLLSLLEKHEAHPSS